MSKEYMRGYNLGYDDGRKVGLLEAYRDVLLNGFERNIDTFEFIRKRIEEFERKERK